MSIADDFFKRYTPDFIKLKEYGFVLKGKSYSYAKEFFDGKFRAEIKISKTGEISDTVFDIENDDEFLPLKIKYNEGSFVADVRKEYENLLLDIRNNCFIKNYFIHPQSNRITNLIIEKYGNFPEFLWEKFDGSGVFRNSETKKWYAAMLDVNRNKLEKTKNGIAEVLNIKLEPERIIELVNNDGFYPAYHMNKKSWISILMDNIVSDDLIMDLVDISYKYTIK